MSSIRSIIITFTATCLFVSASYLILGSDKSINTFVSTTICIMLFSALLMSISNEYPTLVYIIIMLYLIGICTILIHKINQSFDNMLF